MSSRQSVRAFTAEPIDLALIERSVEAAGWAPSPHGTQPWRFVVVAEEHLRFGLADAMGDSWRDQLRSDGVPEVDIDDRVRLSKDRLEQAPVVVVLCLHLGDAHPYPDSSRQDSERSMAVQSLGAAAQNRTLARCDVEGEHGIPLEVGHDQTRAWRVVQDGLSVHKLRSGATQIAGRTVDATQRFRRAARQ